MTDNLMTNRTQKKISIKPDMESFNTPAVQRLMLFLQLYNKNLVETENGILFSEYYEPVSRTLTLKTLKLSSPLIDTVSAQPLQIVRHITGSVILEEIVSSSILDVFRNVVTIEGKLTIIGSDLTDINGFNQLLQLGGLAISENLLLSSINGFSKLNQISNSLLINNNNALLSINGINSLERTEVGNLKIIDNPNLGQINGLISVTHIAKSLHLENLPKLENIGFLRQLRFAVNLSFNRINLADPKPLRHYFKNNPHVKGFIKMVSCGLQDLSFMQGLTRVGSYFYLHKNDLKELSGLSELEAVGKSFSLSSNQLVSLQALSGLYQVGGMLGLINNRLESLNGLEKLARVKTTPWNNVARSIAISGNPHLEDISALKNISEIDKQLIILIDKTQTFINKPSRSSSFADNSIRVTDIKGKIDYDLNLVLSNEEPLNGSEARLKGPLKPIEKIKKRLAPNPVVAEMPIRPQMRHSYQFPIVQANDITDLDAEFVADPFLFVESGKWYLFFEILDRQSGLGVIGVSTSDNCLDWEYKKTVLREDFHLSYPYVFRYNDKIYMIPESNQMSEVRVYEAVDFPYQWTYRATILEGKRYVDASIFQYDYKLWLLVGLMRNKDCHLYSSDNLLWGWQEHPMSPIVSNDKSQARPAGRVFQLQNGHVVRTAQKCDLRYGQRVRAFEITVLNESEYRERELDFSPLLSESENMLYHHSVHHFDAHITDNYWYICSDRRGNKQPWAIDLYYEQIPDYKQCPNIIPIKNISSINANSNVEESHYLKNLWEGPGIGFEPKMPFHSLSSHYWSAQGINQKAERYKENLDYISLDIELLEESTIDGILIWLPVSQLENNISHIHLFYAIEEGEVLDKESFELQLEEAGKTTDIPKLVRFPSISAKYIRLALYPKRAKKTMLMAVQEIAVVNESKQMQEELSEYHNYLSY